MKIKTIRKTISNKFNEWANSITDEELRKQVMDNTIITGGCIASMLQGEQVNDFDVYFRNYATCLGVARYYAATFDKGEVDIRELDGRISVRVTPQAIGVTGEFLEFNGQEEASDNSKEAEAGKKPEFKVLYFSSNAITLSDKIQIVARFYGEPDKIHETYDFAHCTCYWSSWDEKLVTPERALTSMMTRELVYMGSKYPVCSLIRLRKFIARGWTINAGQMLKMILQCTDLDLRTPVVLQDQLVGVDSAYFCEVLKKIDASNLAGGKLTTSYLCEILDRVFSV